MYLLLMAEVVELFGQLGRQRTENLVIGLIVKIKDDPFRLEKQTEWPDLENL